MCVSRHTHRIQQNRRAYCCEYSPSGGEEETKEEKQEEEEAAGSQTRDKRDGEVRLEKDNIVSMRLSLFQRILHAEKGKKRKKKKSKHLLKS